MARLPRLVVPDLPHHLIQRGNDGQRVFCDDFDRRRFLAVLHDVAHTHQLAIHAYVLMDNHVHLLATPAAADGLSRAMQSLGRRFVGWFNMRHGRSGTLWEGRFRCTVIEAERYLLTCMRFIELKPVSAGIVARAADYPWSSASFHLGQRQDQLVTDHRLFWALGNTPFERQAAWRLLLDQGLSDNESKQISDSALKGWACGSEPFLTWLRDRTPRPVAPRRRGRPTSS